MFKIIGAVVVYGFASYGLIVWLQKRHAKDFQHEK